MEYKLIPYPKSISPLKGRVPADAPVSQKVTRSLAKEAVNIRISDGKIEVEGGSGAALLYAQTTLDQLKRQFPDGIPGLLINDEPACSWRSFLIDTARHYIPVDELKKMIRMAAYFKLNRFHWHFSEDQGWRIECRRFPKLHEIGSRRAGDHFGNYCSDVPEGAYYTREETKEIVDYCASFGIEVVPEIDMPGHVAAILAAFPELSCTGEPVEVQTKAMINPLILCAGKEEVFTFMEQLIDDMLELFPGKYFHIGGDEAPKDCWKVCPLCKKRMEEEGLTDYNQLQGYFNNRIAAYLISKGKTPIVWNEAAEGDNLSPETVIEFWMGDKEGHVAKHLQKGGKVILANVKNAYCDYPYSMISLKDIYSMNTAPENYLPEGILGTECLVWTEYIRNAERLETYCWPRFAASAEAGWSGENRPGYSSFAERMEALFPVFEDFGIQATPADWWTPEGEAAEKELDEFGKNFPPEVVAMFRKMRESN